MAVDTHPYLAKSLRLITVAASRFTTSSVDLCSQSHFLYGFNLVSLSLFFSGQKKDHFTVVLTCMRDGTKLKPMVIFKRKTMPKDPVPPGLVVHVHPKGWMDENGMYVWLQKVWGVGQVACCERKVCLRLTHFKHIWLTV